MYPLRLYNECILSPVFEVVLEMLETTLMQEKRNDTFSCCLPPSLPTFCAAAKFFVSVLEITAHFRGFASTRLRSYLHTNYLPDVRLGSFARVVKLSLELARCMVPDSPTVLRDLFVVHAGAGGVGLGDVRRT